MQGKSLRSVIGTMTYSDIAIRLGLALFFSSVIGYERQMNNSAAGLRTHALVGIAATTIALIQSQITADIWVLEMTYPDIVGLVRSDPARLIAQVVSGVGFLGAGTIVVTKRNISGLTTAASIWATSAMGLALGMGYFEIAVTSFVVMIIVMKVLYKIFFIHHTNKIQVKYLAGVPTTDFIIKCIEELNLEYEIVNYELSLYHDQRIVTQTFEVTSKDDIYYTSLVRLLSQNDTIVSVQSTNI